MEEDSDVIDPDENNNIIAKGVGTAYVVAEATDGDVALYARCPRSD